MIWRKIPALTTRGLRGDYGDSAFNSPTRSSVGFGPRVSEGIAMGHWAKLAVIWDPSIERTVTVILSP